MSEVNGHANGHDDEDDGSPALSKFMREHFDLESWSGPIDLHWKPSTEIPPAHPPVSQPPPPETTTGKALKAMLDAGMTPDEIGHILSLPVEDSTRFQPVSSTRADVIAKRRAWDRDYRKRKKAEADRDKNPPAQSQCDLSSLSSPPLEENTKKEVETGDTRARAHRLSENWAPTEQHFELGQSLGHSRQDVLTFAADMRDWTIANDGKAVTKKTNWNSAFNNWVRRQRRQNNVRPGSGLPSSTRQGHGKSNGITTALDQLIEGFERQAGDEREMREAPPGVLPGRGGK